MSGTNVTYNGVELHNVTTQQWEQEVVSDASGTDRLFNRITIKVKGLVHTQVGEDDNGNPRSIRQTPSYTVVGGLAQANAQSTYAQVSTYLTQYRGELKVTMDGKEILHCVPSTPGTMGLSYRDVENGPKSRDVQITHVTPRVLEVSFTISCAMVQCLSSAAPISPVISNRWAISEEMDDKFFITRTIRGRIRFSTSDPRNGPTGHSYKPLVVPRLEAGFRRDRLTYTQVENGLEAEYSVVDKQTTTAAPWPAARISGSHTLTGTTNGTLWVHNLTLRLEGKPDAPRSYLLTRAIQIIDQRTNFLTKRQKLTLQVDQQAYTAMIGEDNAVEVRMQFLEIPGPLSEQFVKGLIEETIAPVGELAPLAGEPSRYNAAHSIAPAIYGYSYEPRSRENLRSAVETFLKQCYLQDPCSPGHGYLNQSPGAGPKGEGTYHSPEVTGATVPSLPRYPNEQDNYSQQTRQALYTVARAESRYTRIPCRVQMPLATAVETGKNDTSKVLTLGPTQARREITVECERVGQWPEIPEPVDFYRDGEIKGTLLKHWDEERPFCLSADGQQRVYHITAYYVYALNRPPRSEERTRVGVLPFTKWATDSKEATLKRNDIYAKRLNVGEKTSETGETQP